ncbi:MAG: polysaccharide biosynthesis protein [Synergistaceae bacterium]|nr:polysaccharide biosynthesis protein [Synergistaceae bacterium]
MNKLMKIANIWAYIGKRPILVAIMDIVSIFIGAYLGYALRFTIFLPGTYWIDLLVIGSIFSSSLVLTFIFLGDYRILWAQSTIEDYTAYVRHYSLGVLIFIVVLASTSIAFIPRSSLGLLVLAGLVFCGTLRVSWRVFVPERLNKMTGKRTIIVGAGEAGTLLARDLKRNPSELMPIGFIDDAPDKIRRSLAGLPVLGTCNELADVIRGNNISVVLIAMPTASSKRIREIFDITASLRVSVRSLPSLRELAGGHIAAGNLREIELEDLLGREAVDIDSEGISSLISGRTVLITGAGGSIGSEIVTQLLDKNPKTLLLLGHGEQSIYNLLEKIKGSSYNSVPELVPIIADVADTLVMPEVFVKWNPNIIYHAAAHKHVPLMQSNPLESLRVNAFGTYQLAMLAGEFKTERMVMISTDKAVNPTSIMGATKRIAELVLNEVQQEFPQTAFMAVRFGNVLGSRGSVIPKFREQIAKGGPITITHPDMKRYFMLTSEAVSLVLQAGAIGKGGEVFVLDMGEPVKISDMADILIRLQGYIPREEIKIEYTGIRDGEKLFEELFYDMKHVDITSHTKIFSSRLNVSKGVSEQVKLAMQQGADNVVSSIIKMVPEFTEN